MASAKLVGAFLVLEMFQSHS